MKISFEDVAPGSFRVWAECSGQRRLLGTAYQTWMLSWKPDAALRDWLEELGHASVLWAGQEAAKLNLQWAVNSRKQESKK